MKHQLKAEIQLEKTHWLHRFFYFKETNSLWMANVNMLCYKNISNHWSDSLSCLCKFSVIRVMATNNWLKLEGYQTFAWFLSTFTQLSRSLCKFYCLATESLTEHHDSFQSSRTDWTNWSWVSRCINSRGCILLSLPIFWETPTACQLNCKKSKVALNQDIKKLWV